MNTRSVLLGGGLLVAFLGGCSAEITAEITPLARPEGAATIEQSAHVSQGLFLEAGRASTATGPTPVYVVRSRDVEINIPLLLDEDQRARVSPGDTVTLNLFPDVSYTGVIEQVEANGDGYLWTGYLQDVEFSQLTMVISNGYFIAKIASPAGVYEVSSAGQDLYRIILIDQQKLQGGEDGIDVAPTVP